MSIFVIVGAEGAYRDQRVNHVLSLQLFAILTISMFANHAVKASRLPPEILSAIFIQCDCIEIADPPKTTSVFGCQLTLPAVCHLWRKVALDTTALWSRVKILNDPPYELLELFLSRSGTAPLDISVHMNKPIEDYDDESVAEETAEEIHHFLKRHCSPSRWGSYRVEVNHINSFYTLSVWPFSGDSTYPSLQSMELIFAGSFSLDPHDGSLGKALHVSHLKFPEPQAQLKCLKIRGLLSPHIFGTSFHQELTSLVHLELRFAGQYEWYDHERNTPATRLLSKDTTSSDVVKALDAPKVHVPTLTTLSFLAISSPFWVLNHLLTLDASNVTTFELTFGNEPLKQTNGGRAAIRQLISYIATSGPVGAKKKPKPLFPSLAHLTFSSLEDCFREDLEVLLTGYPQLKSLTLPKCSTLQPLVKSGSELADIKVGIRDTRGLKELLVARCDAGTPLRAVRVVQQTLNNPLEPSVLKELEELVDFALVDEVEECNNAKAA